MFVVCLLFLPAPVLAAEKDAGSAVKLQVSNFVPNPGQKLGSSEANREHQCEIISFDVGKFNRQDSAVKNKIKEKLGSLSINLVDTEADFIKLDKSARNSTAIYEKINDKAPQCPSGSVTFTKSPISNKTTGTSATNDKCASDDKTITVAINNYPSLKNDEIKDHKFYEDKIGADFMCSHIKIPVAKPKEGINANFDAIKKYLSEQVGGLKLVNNREEFDKLSGDEMKKSVVLSTLKCECQGPNSIDYEGLTFKDGNKILPRKSTASNQMSIGYESDPSKSTGSGQSGSSTSSGSSGSSSSSKGSKASQSGSSSQSTSSTLTTHPLDGNCIKSQGQLFCFIDDTSKSLYKQGKLDKMISITGATIIKDIAASKDKRGNIDMIAIGSDTNIASMYKKAFPSYSGLDPQAFACSFKADLCDKIIKNALGSIPRPNMKIIVVSPGDTNGRYNDNIKLVIDHEWSHIYDAVSTYRESYDTISVNRKYEFIGTYITIKMDPITTWTSYQSFFRSYPKCVSAALMYANGAGHPWRDPRETFASTFETFMNPGARAKMNSGLSSFGSPSKCSATLNETIDNHNTFFNKI